jgi:hypothetical protein
MDISRQRNKPVKGQIRIEAMLHGFAETGTSVSIVVLTQVSIVVLTCCRIAILKYRNIYSLKQKGKSAYQ